MDIVIHIPDHIAARLNADATTLGRRILEVWALAEYKSENITKPELRVMLGFETRYELDGFLKAHNVMYGYTIVDFELERKALKDAGF